MGIRGLAVMSFLLLGGCSNSSDNGRYSLQFISHADNGGADLARALLLDTRTGKLWSVFSFYSHKQPIVMIGPITPTAGMTAANAEK